jgi:tRNA (guanine26-N2/guanine27-N2)-dimethyltransferase
MQGDTREGAAALRTSDAVFFNDRQELQRDLSVLVVQEYAAAKSADRLTLVDALTGSGVRAIRYLREVAGVRHAIANDVDGLAVQAARANAALSGIEKGALRLTQSPADTLLLRLACEERRRVDVIDLDPCGCVAELLPAAVGCVCDGGLLYARARATSRAAATHHSRREDGRRVRTEPHASMACGVCAPYEGVACGVCAACALA